MTDRDEFFLARTDAVHEKLTEWIEAIQKQSPDELANFMSRPPAVLAEYLLQRLTRRRPHADDSHPLTGRGRR